MKTVIIADDEPVFRMDLSAALSRLGYSVAGEAADGFDAVELCRKTRPDVAVLDVRMPVFDGLTAAGKILKENLAGCVVLLTAYSDEDFIARATEVGVTGYLVKPLDENSLKSTVEVAHSTRRKMLESGDRARAAEIRLRDRNLIDRAKFIIARRENILEGEAYRRLQKAAMEKRLTLAEAAAIVVEGEK